MKKNLCKATWLLLLGAFVGLPDTYSQSGHEILEKQDLLFKANLMSPQSFSFNKYGGHQMSLSTGQVNVQVPVYTYKDNNFEIPIYIAYGSSGFMPNQREGIVGLGWTLNAGGAITRVVNGVPDDSHSVQNPFGYYQLNGLLYGIKNNLAIKSASKANILNLSAGTTSINLFWHIGTCEAEPDYFNFNVPGLSGKFYIQNNGEIRTLGNKPFKVNLSGVGMQYMQPQASSSVASSSITIITDDGYKYEFGGSVFYLEVAYTLDESGDVYNPNINTWHLTKITAPNGQIVEYKYKNFISGIHQDNNPNDKQHYLFNINYQRVSNSDEHAYSGGAYGAGGNSSMQIHETATKTAYLEEILIVGRALIKFYYVENANQFYNTIEYTYHNFNQKNLRVDKIEVTDYLLQKRKEFELGYTYLGGTYNRLFLTSFKETGQNPHTFTYYNTSNLPSPLTAAVDHWGFWNGAANTYGATIPASTFHTNGDVTITGSQRDPDITKCKTAMLEKITYPTKGYSQFDYEPHSYSKRLERRNDFNFLPKLYDVSGNVGGARISQVKEFDGSQITNIKDFKYTKNYPSVSTSSGILLQWPRYLFYWENNNGAGTSKHLKTKSSSFNNSYAGNESFIQYSEVSEISSGNGYTNYIFTDFFSHPDENGYQTAKLHPTDFDGISNSHLHNSYVGIAFNDKHFERGVPKHIRHYRYNDTGPATLVKETKTNSFTGVSDYPDSYIAGAHMTGGIVQSFKKYYYPFLPKQVEETTYGSSGETITVVHDYQYNNHGYLMKHTTTRSDGSIVSNTASYPDDFASGTTFLNDMKTNNLLNYPIERVKYIEKGGSKFILSGQIVKYKPTGKGQIDEVLELETSSSIPIASFKFSNRNIGVLPPAGTPAVFNADSRYKADIIYSAYDNAGNVAQVEKTNNIKYSYLWDYNNQYPVAEAVNALNNTIAYTSFEADGKGNWNNYTGTITTVTSGTLPPTGRKYYNLTASATLSKAVTNGQKYIVSYWRNNSSPFTLNGGTGTIVSGPTINSWTLHRHEVTASSTTLTITGSGAIDEVRLYPENAQMTTYTYEPLIGMTSQCDVNNRITYYRYDGFGRLNLVLDQDGNIVKKICYNYAGQPEACNIYYNTAQSGNFIRECPPGHTGSTVTYTVPANTYSAYTQAAANQLAQNDVSANGQNYANTVGVCTASGCTLSSSSGFTIVTYSMSFSGGITNFSFTVYANGGANWTTVNQIGTITGPCKPSTTSGTTVSENGRYWQVMATSSGALTVQLVSGSPPSGSSNITLSGSYGY
ncbi:MAG: hypothetical protein KIT80_13255 [Chitinophagaceae bacterium]|nr:hypothetical protein [Chitinophagaceae bacterium]MCW5927875.1 hypothetical protein [Chitinophagaceae bacterium]